ncbi:hypothetical protein P9314_05415 [Paenibacillus validus]|uniref:Uncharacterized protein n=1 Tax=Paenibacillus validus TaxID=44253 RepID=A0A7X2ZEY2_9BACL|nr:MULTISPECIES: hypothetical protein [Paenibacillus]MED4600149.1 hypothetical protein [Paenibacillus validus]MED4607679.1 hypothetical protein [Paenibacillus validus]MUG73070.1 hypothetical protein [Paenibacillus validus]
MNTELLFMNQKIPVSFISSDQKAIPQLINILERNSSHSSAAGTSDFNQIDRIEIIGNNAVLHKKHVNQCIELPLY